MLISRWRRVQPTLTLLALCLVFPVVLLAQACPECCVEGPLPENPENNLRLCSPSSSELRAVVSSDGTVLEWDVPPASETTFLGPLEAIVWDGVAEGGPPPGVTVTGVYGGITDRRIEISITKINGADTLGTTGQGVVTVFWQTIFETRPGGGIIGGEIEITSANVDTPIPMVTTNGDTTLTAGLRLRVANGLTVKNSFRAAFTAEDFEGYIVWRWLSDPSLAPESWGRFNRRAGTFVPPKPPEGQFDSWPGTETSSPVVRFRDTSNFDGLTYHYAVTAFDQGFKPKSGQSYGLTLSSPLESADPTTGQLGPTQVVVAFRQASPSSFAAAVAYPNPYRESECSMQDAAGTCQVHFKNMPAQGTLQVFTMSGDLVWEKSSNNDNPGTISWDTNNGAGESVASGVYIYKITDLSSGQQSFGRLTVIR